MNVHIADDHEVLLRGYQSVFEGEDINITGYSNNGIELLDWLKNNACDVLLLDIEMSPIDGFEALKLFKQEHIKVKVIIVSSFGQEMFVAKAIELGVKGYVLKEEAGDVIVKALKEVFAGGVFYSKKVQELILSQNLDVDYDKIIEEKVTPRELQVLELLHKEFSSSEIEEELKMSGSSLRTFLQRLRNKFMVPTNVGLAKRSYLYLKNKI
ncbi:response regulator transcription factor [Tenacibaculum sp. Mcav3-52]|uniref:response regulator n=1 Tax=Tenacibaculum sp. Mcav3-52 TaxID=2917762 RepID=UPI001EF26C66|nr:response regulator transcription factor [Tenacibaculum sp. Mcav3-52]MCG7502423.1 response regulator transcription factor [Tenacibaculum sp. Mcav3-52]